MILLPLQLLSFLPCYSSSLSLFIAGASSSGSSSTIGGFAALTVDNPASAGVKNSKENRYFLIAAAAGLVVALAVPFVYEIIADEVYDAKDITDWGVPATLIDASKGVKVEKGSKEEEAK